MRKYKIIYADPPWQYRDSANSGKRGAVHKYPVMSLADLCALNVSSLADDDCLLAMWWVPPMPLEAFEVVRAWGFEITNMMAFTWAKTTKTGKFHFGMGNMTRANAEACLFAKRAQKKARYPKRVDASVRSLVISERRAHSAKPDAVRDCLVRLLGDVPRVELFARTTAPGWDAYGYGIDGQDIRSAEWARRNHDSHTQSTFVETAAAFAVDGSARFALQAAPTQVGHVQRSAA